MLALTSLSLLPRAALGFLIVDLVWRGPSRSRVLQVFMSAPVGVGLSSLLSFLWIWAGLNLRTYAIVETAAVLIAFALWVRPRIGDMLGALRGMWSRWPPRRLGWWVALAAAAVLAFALFWTGAMQRPHGSWDAWQHWTVVSRFVYRGGPQWQATFLRFNGQPDYPFLLAMSNATTWELVGSETSRGPMALAFVYTVCLVGVMFGLVRKLGDSSQACMAAIVLLTLPLLVDNGISQYADIPAACYFLMSAGMMLLYLQSGEKAAAVLAGLSAGLAAWTKNEGLAFNVASLAVWALISVRRRSPAIKHYLLGAAFPLVVIGLFKAFLAPSGDLFARPQVLMAAISNPARYRVVLLDAGRAFIDLGLLGPLVLLAVYGALVGGRRGRPAGLPYVAFMFAAQAAADLMVYVASPYAYGAGAMIPTSISRLWVQVFPLLVAGVFLLLKSPEELTLAGSVEARASNAVTGAGS